MSEQLELLGEDEAREYSESLSLITEGWMRQYLWAIRNRVPEALGMTRDEWTVKYHRPPKLSVPDRRNKVAGLLDEGLNNSEIADALGVDEGTVRNDRKSENSEPHQGEHAQEDEDASENSEPHQGKLPDDSEIEAPINWRAPFPDDAIIDSAFRYYRTLQHPFPVKPVHVSMQEINALARADASGLLSSKLANRVADTYHPHRWKARSNKNRSPLEAFSDDATLRKALRLALSYHPLREHLPSEVALVDGTQAASNFRPGAALWVYRKYGRPGGVVLDTSTGYGGRLVGFMASELGRYIGIDPNSETHQANLRMVTDLGFAERVELHMLPAEDVEHEVEPDTCDLAFTSPPYFTKEHYSSEPTQSWLRYPTGEEWRGGFLVPMMALQYSALKSGGYSVVNIADVRITGREGRAWYPLEDWTKDAALQVGFKHVGTVNLPRGSQFGNHGDANLTSRSEPMFVFQKA